MIDIPGLFPKREEESLKDGSVKVSVTPPSFMGLPTQSLVLSKDQYQRYCAWRDGSELIQTALPELSGAERELLISGIGPDDWDRMFKDDDE